MSTALTTVSFRSGNLSSRDAELVHTELRGTAEVMHTLQQQWQTVTTATRPSHEYVTATTALHERLTAIERDTLTPSSHVDVAQRINVYQALTDLRYTATDLVELTHTAALLPDPLIRTGLLFAPARILPSTMERLNDRNHGRYVAIHIEEGTELIDAAQQGSRAARRAQTALEITARPTATKELFAQTLTARFPSQELDLTTGLSGPELL